MQENVATVVDAKGQSCPMPVLMTAKAAKQLASGDLMLVESTDAGSKSDIPAWAKQTGNELVESETEGPVFRYVIRKK